MSGLLDGYRILESAQLITGDRVGMLLADMGADVIKIESPGRGDPIRWYPGQITPGHSPAHIEVNRNKRSVALDLGCEAGREVFWRLLATADAFVDGNAGDVCQRLGVGYEEQARRKPDIVYCQLTGFGAAGPYAGIPSHSWMMNALAGVYVVESDGDARVRQIDTLEGLTTGGGNAAFCAPVTAALYLCGALARRAQGGGGCHIDVSAAETVLSNAFLTVTNALNADRITDWSTVPESYTRVGARYDFYATKDGAVVLFCAIEPHFWRNFCRAIGRPDLERAISGTAGVDYGGDDPSLASELREIFRSRDAAEWVAIAIDHDVPIGPNLSTVDELRRDPHHRAREIFVEGFHPGAGPFTHLREPAVVDTEPFEVRQPAPQLSEHTNEILSELGFRDSDITRLDAEGVIGVPALQSGESR